MPAPAFRLPRRRPLLTAALSLCVLGSAGAAEPMLEFVVVRADTLIGLSRSVLVSPTAWREVARINRLADPDRIMPGQRLRIPARLLRGDAVDATLVSVAGPNVTAGGAAAVLGAAVPEGTQVQTGPDSSAVLALADGSRVRVAPSSLAQVAASRHYGSRLPTNAAATPEAAAAANAGDGWFAGTLRMLRGSVEVVATKVLRARPLEVVTPTALVGVRGTRYRVALEDTADQRTHAEVLEGVVSFEPATGPRPAADGGAALRAGFGASLGAGTDAGTTTVAALLPPPDLGALPDRFERPVVRIPAAGETVPLRVQVAADPDFDQIVSDQRVAPGTEARIAGLADATWYLRARRIGVAGIEGRDTVRPFVLKARPEPPAYLRPRSGDRPTVGSVELAWAPNVEAPRARVQVARDPAFLAPVAERDNVDAADLHVDLAEPGTYYWRLASVRPDGDHGPFGDPQAFEVRALPEPPRAGRAPDGSLVFTWSGRAGDRHQVQFARDPAFTEIVDADEVGGTQWTLAPPGSGGRYYFRYRSVEPDGFVTPYSETLRIDVPRDWSGVGLLVPLLLLLL